VTFEDHVLMGGYGSAVLELLADRRITTPVVRIGWPDQFIEHASTVDYLREKYGLTPQHAVEQVRAVLARQSLTIAAEPQKNIAIA
jgi:1-deoxy-D-xylulose-5-phosphate synthase